TPGWCIIVMPTCFTKEMNTPRHRILKTVVLVLISMAVWKTVAAQFDIDPSLTYLLTSNDSATPGGPQVGSPMPINLSLLGLSPGDSVRLDSAGSYYYDILSAGLLDQAIPMIGVFSSSTTILPNDQLNRVVGAIAAGTPFISLPTYVGGLSTDI